MPLCPSPSSQVRIRHEAQDSHPARFSSSGIGSSLCSGGAAWVKSTAPKIFYIDGEDLASLLRRFYTSLGGRPVFGRAVLEE
jgi:hypothetical protein